MLANFSSIALKQQRDFACLVIRHEYGNYLSTMLAVDSKIAVACQQGAFRKLLRHADQASISQRHGHIRISAHKRTDPSDVIAQSERHLKQPSIDQLQNGNRTGRKGVQEKARLRDHCLTGKERWSNACQSLGSPGVISISTIEEGDQGARID
jgi:hypothetical protein